MLAFITYSLVHSDLQAANIFSSLALFYGLRIPLNMLPMVLAQSIDAWVSLGRIQDYLLAEEEQEKRKINEHQEHAFNLANASFTWEDTVKSDDVQENSPELLHGGATAKQKDVDLELGVSSEGIAIGEECSAIEVFQLDKINLAVHRTELLAIVGGVGSGKTSLLAALAGDMRKVSGEITQGAAIAYCPQFAWIRSATVRENVTFGRPFDQEWYDRVVDACALRADFQLLPDGDQTEVGERGITLSGGQKQRLNIARAIYFDAPIVLMDDPLSAVDAQVGRHIFREAICGLLKDKCRVLATHQLHVLGQCDRIIWMQNGKIEAIGTYDELMAHNPGFVQMLSMTDGHNEDSATRPPDSSAVKSGKSDTDKVSQDSGPNTIALPKAAELMGKEEKGERGIKWAVYRAYIKASGSVLMVPFTIVFVCLAQASNIMSTVWLGYWTTDQLSLANNIYVSTASIPESHQSMISKLTDSPCGRSPSTWS